ncbi:hypothetical protein [Flavicella sediminum]|uniref:hypothetical protein n=1 Tax=Flavicella sediminum TaxID=2585141 RepID=UPI001FB715D2|nr:hypothetical protein [Flavicella sediminum]
MKNKIIIALSFVFAGLFVACQDEDYDEPNSFSDVGWYTSQLRQAEYNVGVGKYISFTDLSMGEIEHTWTIGEGNFFLKGPIQRLDSVFDKFIINAGDTVSTDPTIHVLFQKGGMQNVRLFNTFEDSVAFRGPAGLIIPSVKVGDRWVMDQTFTVDVYDTIVPIIELSKGGAVIAHSNPLDTIKVEAGESLDITDLTVIGRPTTIAFNVGDAWASTQPGGTATVVLKKLGLFEGAVNVSRSGQNIPGDWETYKIGSPIKVIPSSQPFVVTGTIAELEDQTIQIPFNGEFAPFAAKESFFEVKVNDVPASIKSLTINSSDETILDIELNDPIYKTDMVTVSLMDGSGIESTDTRTPVAFTDQPVKMYDLGNLFDVNASGFEDAGVSGVWEPSWESDILLEYSTEQAASGTYSMKWTLDGVERKRPGFTMYNAFANGAKVNLKAGKTYRFSYKFYAVAGNTSNATWPHLTGGGLWKGYWTGISGDPVDQWVEKSIEYTADSDVFDVTFMMRLTGDDTTRGVVYFDDFYLDELDDRP